MLRRPLVITAIVSCICAVLAYYLKNAVLLYSVISMLIAILLFLKLYRYIIPLLLCFVVIGSSVTVQDEIAKINKFNGTSMPLQVVAISDLHTNDGYSYIDVKTITESGIGKNVKMRLFGDFKRNVKTGEKFYADIKIKSLKDDSYQLYNYSNRYYVTANLDRYLSYLGKDELYTKIGDLRRYINITVDENFYGESAGLIKAITLGNKDGMSESLQINIRKSGVSHVVVVSGMHLAIILYGLFGVFNKIFYNRYFKVALSLGAVFLISALCGFSVSVMRAGIMFIISSLALLFYRDSDVFNSLALTVILLLISSPLIIFNVSFQLSVLATFSIVWVAPVVLDLIKKKFKYKNKFINYFIESTVITLMATLFTMPIVIYRFEGISTVAVITNVLIAYAVNYLLQFVFFGLVLAAVSFLYPFAEVLFFLAELLSRYSLYVINTLGNLKFSYIECSKYMSIPAAILVLFILAAVEIYDILIPKKALKFKKEEVKKA